MIGELRKFFEKNLTKNFFAWVRCEHCAFGRRAHYAKQKNNPCLKVFEGWGFGGRYNKHTQLHNEIGCVSLKFDITMGDFWLSALPTFFQKVSFPRIKPQTTKKGEPPTRVLPLSLQAKKFTLSCVFRTIREFRSLRRATQGSALRARKFFEKNLTKNFFARARCEHCAFWR